MTFGSMVENKDLNLADAFTSQATCSLMLEQFARELSGLDSTVAILALEGIHRIGIQLFTQDFKLNEDIFQSFNDILRHWRGECPLRASYSKRSVSQILKCLTIFKSMNTPLYVGDSGRKITLSEYGEEIENIDIDENTLLYYYADSLNDGRSDGNAFRSTGNKEGDEFNFTFSENLNSRLYWLFPPCDIHSSHSCKSNIFNVDTLNAVLKAEQENENNNGVSLPLNSPLLHYYGHQSRSHLPNASTIHDYTVDPKSPINEHCGKGKYNPSHDENVNDNIRGKTVRRIKTTTLFELGVTGLCQGEIIYKDNDQIQNRGGNIGNMNKVYVILYAVHDSEGNFTGLKRPKDAILKSMHHGLCSVEIVILGPDTNCGDSPRFQPCKGNIGKAYFSSNLDQMKNNGRPNVTSDVDLKNENENCKQQVENPSCNLPCVSDFDIVSGKTEKSSKSAPLDGENVLHNKLGTCGSAVCDDRAGSENNRKNRSPINNTRSCSMKHVRERLRCRADIHMSEHQEEYSKICIDLVGAFTSPEGCKMFFEQLTCELSNVNETVGLLALEGLFRLDKVIGELCDTKVKQLLRVNRWICFADGVRKLLYKWVCNFPTGSVPEMWWRLRYCLLVYRTLEVPMFVDYLFKVNIKGLRSFADNQLEEIVVDGDTPIFHITHRAEAWSILEQNRFRANNRKNAVEGTWFSPGEKANSIYGSKCFKTSLSLLGVTGLYQGEIVYYKDERNVILYATDDPGVNFKGLVKPTELFIKEEAKTLPVNKDRNARPFVHVSIFVPARFLPNPGKFRQVVSQTEDVSHRPFCIRVCRRYRNGCDELPLCLTPSFNLSPPCCAVPPRSAFDSGIHPCPYPLVSTSFNQPLLPFPSLPLHFPQHCQYPHPNPHFLFFFLRLLFTSSPINFFSHHFPQPAPSQIPQRQYPLPGPSSLRNQPSDEATDKQKKKKRKKKKKINTNKS